MTEFGPVQPPTAAPSTRMPGALKAVVVVLVVQIVGNVLVALLLLSAISEAAQHNEELVSPGLASASVIVSFLAAAGLVLGLVLLLRRDDRGRYVVIGVELLTAVGGLISLFTGTATGGVSIVLTAVVISTLARGEAVRAWFGTRRPA